MGTTEVIYDYLIKYPLRYCVPVYIGILTRGDQTLRSGGTATLVQLLDRRFVITDNHVVVAFERYRVEDDRVKFQVGRSVFDPQERRIDRSASKDLFVMNADGLDLDDRSPDDDLPPLEFYVVPEADSWPPQMPKIGETVLLGGYPGSMRRSEGFNVSSGSYTVAGIPVTGIFANRFSCNIDRATWRSSRASDTWVRGFKEWGGLSGGPVFLDGPNLLRPMLCGFIQEYHPQYDQLQVSHAAHVHLDGTIERGLLF